MDLYLKKKERKETILFTTPFKTVVFGTKNGQFKKKIYIYYLKNAECYVREKKKKKDFSYV